MGLWILDNEKVLAHWGLLNQFNPLALEMNI